MATQYFSIPTTGGLNWLAPVANAAALPVTGNVDGDARITLNDQSIYVWKESSSAWIQAATPAATSAITALNTDVSAVGPGAVIATIQPNVVTNSKLATMPTLTLKGNSTGVTANASDLTTASVKTMLNLAGTNSGDVTLTAVGAVPNSSGASLSGQVLTLQPANSTNPGVLLAADFNTFSAKQPAGNYLTALTGDATATGPGSAALTLATVNGNVGSFGTATQVSTLTVNAKGLITAASNTSIQIAQSQVTNLVSDLAGKQATGNYVTALTGDVTASGPGSVAATIATGAVTDAKASLAVKPAVTVVATTNQALTGTPTIDGISTVSGSIILLAAQSTGSENGPWVAAAGAWARPSWYPSGGTTQSFQFITTFVRLGTTYRGSTWRQTAAAPITIDTTATTWVVTPYALNTNTVVPGANNTHLTTIAGVVAWTTDPSIYIVSTISSNTSAVSGNTYLCNTSGGAFNVTLPTPVSGAFINIKDSTGSFNTNNLSILRNAAESIEGLAATKVLQTNWGAWSFFSDGTNWFMGPF